MIDKVEDLSDRKKLLSVMFVKKRKVKKKATSENEGQLVNAEEQDPANTKYPLIGQFIPPSTFISYKLTARWRHSLE